MKYEVAYISLSGNTERLAHGIADSLPHQKTFVTDLATEEITKKADVYLIGFGINKGTLPLKIMELLDELHDKTIIFFVTGGLEPLSEYRSAVERKIIPFLPDNCDYRGLFLCQGQFPEKVLETARRKLDTEPNNPIAKKIVADSELSEGHPNTEDIENACQFIQEHLKI